jgi:hypothetical protein
VSHEESTPGELGDHRQALAKMEADRYGSASEMRMSHHRSSQL